jgi:hypothetical protein
LPLQLNTFSEVNQSEIEKGAILGQGAQRRRRCFG